MTAESICEEIKQALNGRAGQPIVLGVCQSIASRLKQEAWCVRLVTIILAVFWTFPVIAAYIVLGFVLSETEDRTRGFFAGMAILIRETAGKVFESLGRIFGSGSNAGSRNRGY